MNTATKTTNLPAAPQETKANLPMVMDYGTDAGAGLENVSFDEISIPFIRIIQTNNPQVDPTEAKYIPDAKPGMLFSTATNELFPGLPLEGGKITGMDFIPCHRDKNYVEYTPRTAGGGFVGIHQTDDPRIVALKQKQGGFKKLVTSNGTELTETKYIYGLFMPAPDYVFPAVLGLASTQIKRYTAFMDTVTKIKYPTGNPEIDEAGGQMPPMWAHRWHLSVVPDSNKKGKFFSFHLALVNGAKLPKPIEARIERSKPAEEALYQRAKSLYESIKAGRASAAYETTDAKDAPDDDMPF